MMEYIKSTFRNYPLLVWVAVLLAGLIVGLAVVCGVIIKYHNAILGGF
jgi:hypothetical protein